MTDTDRDKLRKICRHVDELRLAQQNRFEQWRGPGDLHISVVAGEIERLLSGIVNEISHHLIYDESEFRSTPTPLS